MNILDIFILLFLVSSLLRGYQIGMVRQAGSTLGFLAGLLLGSFLASRIVPHIADQLNRSLANLLIVLGISFILMAAGEMLGIRLKARLLQRRINGVDGGLGSVMSAVTFLAAIWLAANILVLSSNVGLQQLIAGSRVVATLNRHLPPATKIIGELNHLIDPNGFPRVFTGLEPAPKNYQAPASLGSLRPAVQADQASVVKVEGAGCGGIVEGSGFVIAKGMIATNAHVVAGVLHPQVIDSNGRHDTRVVWFDPDVDLAVLSVNNLAGKPLVLNAADQAAGTAAAVMGFPGGGDLSTEPARIIDRFQASGRNIYGQGTTVREVYSIAGKVIPGNSGGPMIGSDGQVLGIVFATSTTYNDVGYVLTAQQVQAELAQATQSQKTVGTGTCSE